MFVYFLSVLLFCIIFTEPNIKKTCYIRFPTNTGHITHNLMKTRTIHYNVTGTITFDEFEVQPIGNVISLYYNILLHLDKCKNQKTTKYIQYISDD